LHISVARSSPPEFVSFLLDLEIDPNSVDDDGMTPLFVVATLGQDPRIGMILIEAGADLSIKTNNGLSAWDMIQSNAALKFSDFYWILNDAEYE
jgi:ankyrin repeat protein